MGRWTGQKPGEHGGRPDRSAATECLWAQQHPAIWEYLNELTWPSGKPRDGATLLVMVDDGKVKVCLNDRANQRSTWSSGDTFTGALGALEEAIQTESAEWRKSRPGPRGGK